MKMKHLVYATITAAVPFFTGSASAESTTVQPTLWGIYGAHNLHDCPVNNRETAKEVIAISQMDLGPLWTSIILVSNTLFSGLSRRQRHIIWKSFPSNSVLPAGTT